MESHARASAQGISTRIVDHCEGRIRAGLPHVLHWIIVALGCHGYLVSHQEGRVEADAKLSNEIGISTLSHSLQEVCGTRLGNSSQVVDKVRLGHPNARIHDGDGLCISVMLDLHLQIFGVSEESLVLDAVETCLLQCICSVGDKL